MVYPAIVAVVALVFTIALVNQYRTRRKAHQLLWAIALLLGLSGALGYLAALQGSAAGFRIYYLAGALWMAPIMGLGSVYLHFGPGRSRWVAVVVILLGLGASAGVLGAPVDGAALARLDGGPGQDVLDLEGLPLAALILSNTFGLVAVAGLALRSALRSRQSPEGRGFAVGNLLLALGVLLLGLAGGLARLGVPGTFWIMMALGFLILYAGFNRINRAAAQASQAQGDRPAAGV